MSEALIIALVSFAGTALGTLGGILTSSKLTNYRIEQLEIKVDKHNNFALRLPVMEQQIKGIDHRLESVEDAIMIRKED